MGSVGITVDLMKRGSRREQKNCHAAGIHSAWCAAVGTGAGCHSGAGTECPVGSEGHWALWVLQSNNPKREVSASCLLAGPLLTREGLCELLTAPLPVSSVMFALSLEKSSGTEVPASFFSG